MLQANFTAIFITESNRNHTGSFVVIDVDTLQLQVGVAMVGAGRINTMLVRDHLPELPHNQTPPVTYQLSTAAIGELPKLCVKIRPDS